LSATITVETVGAARESATVFRLRINDKMVGEGLTADQAHLLVGNALKRVSTLGKQPMGMLLERLNASDSGELEPGRAHRHP